MNPAALQDSGLGGRAKRRGGVGGQTQIPHLSRRRRMHAGLSWKTLEEAPGSQPRGWKKLWGSTVTGTFQETLAILKPSSHGGSWSSPLEENG